MIQRLRAFLGLVVDRIFSLPLISGVEVPRPFQIKIIAVFSAIVGLAVAGYTIIGNISDFKQSQNYDSVYRSSFMQLPPFSSCPDASTKPSVAPFPTITICSLPCMGGCQDNASAPFRVESCVLWRFFENEKKWVSGPCQYVDPFLNLVAVGTEIQESRIGEHCVTLNRYGEDVAPLLSFSTRDMIRLRLSLADDGDVDIQPWSGVAVAYHSPRENVSLLYGDTGEWNFLAPGQITRLSARAHLNVGHKNTRSPPRGVMVDEYLKRECGCPFSKLLEYSTEDHATAPLRKELANEMHESILSLSLHDLDVYCSVEIPGKQYPELVSEVAGSLSIVGQAVQVATFIGTLFLSLVSCLCELKNFLKRRRWCPCIRKRSAVREDDIELNAL